MKAPLTDTQILTLREILQAESRQCLDRLRQAAHAELRIQLVRALSDGILTRPEIQRLCRSFQGFAQVYGGAVAPEADGGVPSSPDLADEIVRFALGRFEREPAVLAEDPAHRRAYAERIRALIDAGFAKTLAILSESPAEILEELRRIRRAIAGRLDVFTREGTHTPGARRAEPLPLAG